jgi:hypothetical protein
LVEIEPRRPCGKGKGMGGIMPTLKKLATSFTRVQMWKQYNKLRTANTADMDAEELTTHRKVLRLIKKDINFAT